MCGRFTSLLSPELLAVIYEIFGPPESTPRYNIAPSQPVSIVRQNVAGQRELATVKWGLIPSWAKDPSIGHSLNNARGETVAEKPSFRAAFKQRRCIIPASGFYEWLRQSAEQNSLGTSRATKTGHCLWPVCGNIGLRQMVV